MSQKHLLFLVIEPCAVQGSLFTSPNLPNTVFEPGRDFATLSRFLFECRTKINHPRHHVATKYEMSRVFN